MLSEHSQFQTALKSAQKRANIPEVTPAGAPLNSLISAGLRDFSSIPATSDARIDPNRPSKTPPLKVRNPLRRPALRDGVTGRRDACDPLPLSSTKIDRLLRLHILVLEGRTLGAHSPHTAPCNLGGACALLAPPSPHTTHPRPRNGVVMHSAPCQVERTPHRTSPPVAAPAVELLPAPAQTSAAHGTGRWRFGSAGWCSGDNRCA